jgi:hypothetical protein
MKNHLFCAFFLLCALTAHTQITGFSQNSLKSNAGSSFHVGLKAGINISNMKFTGNGVNLSYSALAGFNGGLALELGLTESIGLRTGLEVQTKGTKTNNAGSDNFKIRPIYLELPLVVAYSTDQFFIGAGPALGFGIAGNTRTESSGYPTIIQKIVWGSGASDDFKAFDLGLRFEIGAKFGNTRTGVSFNQGLINILPDTNGSGEKGHNWCFSIFAEYMFL